MPSETDSHVFSVSQINDYIKMLLDGEPRLQDVTVKGEISNFKNNYSGHLYFTLKDEGGVLRAVMFRSAAAKLVFLPENGLHVLARGRIAAYVRDGQYQIYIQSLEPDGIGALYLAYEQLKKKLEAEGLFRLDRKRPLPKIPTRVGIVTSPTGAAVRDMMQIIGRRFPYAEIVLYPSLVQGEGAAAQICEGIRTLNRLRRVDVIIIGRGGGSIEDLWAFNDETLARTIRASAIPIISAVGHETDFTIADFAADKRAPTPSAAAELAVPDTAELQRKIGNIIGHMELALRQRLALFRRRVADAASRRVLQNPVAMIEEKRMTVLSAERQLGAAMRLLLGQRRTDFVRITAGLQALNPLAILSRGYAAVFASDGSVLSGAEQMKIGETITLRSADGEADATVQAIRLKQPLQKSPPLQD